MHDSLFRLLYQKNVTVHQYFDHFNFLDHSKAILVVGPMGSGKTEYARRVWKDSQVARRKSQYIAECTSTGSRDRRRVIYCRSALDLSRFEQYPKDMLVSRAGVERMGDELVITRNSFDIESLIDRNSQVGTWIIDEAGFYDDRLAFVIEHAITTTQSNFVLPTLLLNFRNQLFNKTTELLISRASDIYLFTAYCEHPNCLSASHCTYRYYMIDGKECPAPYFDPLILIGGDKKSGLQTVPNYETRCEAHHYLPAMNYCYLFLKPAAVQASSGYPETLLKEFEFVVNDIENSELYSSVVQESMSKGQEILLNSLNVPLLAERMLLYLYLELQLLSEDMFISIVRRFSLQEDYLHKRFAENSLRQMPLGLETSSF